MKKNVLKILSILLIPTLLTGCRTSISDNNNDDNTDSCTEFTSKKIAKQYVLNYEWNYSYVDFASNSTFSIANLITSKSGISNSNSLINYVYNNQFKGAMNPNGAVIEEDIFSEYDDAYFEDHILIIGAVYEKVGCTLYTSGVSNSTYTKYSSDSNGKQYVSDSYTPFYIDTVFETKPIENVEKRLIFFVYDEFKISESSYKNKSKSEIVTYFTNTNTNKSTRLKYYNPYDYYKDLWNKNCPNNKID